jgi:hypothetical protein
MAVYSLGPLIGKPLLLRPQFLVNDQKNRACRRSHCWRIHRSDHRGKICLHHHCRYEHKFQRSLDRHKAKMLPAVCGVSAMIGIPFLRETYSPIIRLRRARRSNDPEAIAKVPSLINSNQSKMQFLWVNLSRPVIMLTRSFICFILSLYMSLCVHISFTLNAHSKHIYFTAYMVSPRFILHLN